MKIKGIVNITDIDPERFYKKVNETISSLQEDGQIVEVQYSTNIRPDSLLVQCALILGRVPEEEQIKTFPEEVRLDNVEMD